MMEDEANTTATQTQPDALAARKGDVLARSEPVLAAARNIARGQQVLNAARDLSRLRRDPSFGSDPDALDRFEEELSNAEAALQAVSADDQRSARVDEDTLGRFLGWFDGNSATALEFKSPVEPRQKKPKVAGITPQQPLVTDLDASDPKQDAKKPEPGRRPWRRFRRLAALAALALIAYTAANWMRDDRSAAVQYYVGVEQARGVESFGDGIQWGADRPILEFFATTANWAAADLGSATDWAMGLFDQNAPVRVEATDPAEAPQDAASIALAPEVDATTKVLEAPASLTEPVAVDSETGIQSLEIEAAVQATEDQVTDVLTQLAFEVARSEARLAKLTMEQARADELNAQNVQLGRDLNELLATNARLRLQVVQAEARQQQGLAEIARSASQIATLETRLLTVEAEKDAAARALEEIKQRDAQTPTHVITVDRANVRSGPRGDAQRLGALERGAPLVFTGEESGGWKQFVVDLDGQRTRVWVSDRLTDAITQ